MPQRVKVTRGKTRSHNYNSERLDIGLEYDLPDTITKGELLLSIEDTVAFLERRLNDLLPEI